MADLRIGGMALRDGVLLQSQDNWAAAVRLPDGSVKVRSGPKSRLPGRGVFDRVPVVRGVSASHRDDDRPAGHAPRAGPAGAPPGRAGAARGRSGERHGHRRAAQDHEDGAARARAGRLGAVDRAGPAGGAPDRAVAVPRRRAQERRRLRDRRRPRDGRQGARPLRHQPARPAAAHQPGRRPRAARREARRRAAADPGSWGSSRWVRRSRYSRGWRATAATRWPTCCARPA